MFHDSRTAAINVSRVSESIDCIYSPMNLGLNRAKKHRTMPRLIKLLINFLLYLLNVSMSPFNLISLVNDNVSFLHLIIQ